MYMYVNLTDEQLVCAVFEKYGDLANEGIEKVPEPKRTLIAVYSSCGVIGNGGFKYFFERGFSGKQPYNAIVECYENAGMSHHAAILRAMLSLFPDGAPQTDETEREEFLAKVFDEESPEYNPEIGRAERQFYGAEPNPYVASIRYVRACA